MVNPRLGPGAPLFRPDERPSFRDDVPDSTVCARTQKTNSSKSPIGMLPSMAFPIDMAAKTSWQPVAPPPRHGQSPTNCRSCRETRTWGRCTNAMLKGTERYF